MSMPIKNRTDWFCRPWRIWHGNLRLRLSVGMAILITIGPSERDHIYKALISNVNEITTQNGVHSHNRRDGLIDLVTTGLVDPKSALNYLES